MTQKGPHTWDLYLQYHRCPQCGYIIESRQDFENRFGKYVKELKCNRCDHQFSLEKSGGPSFGAPQTAEFDWQ